MIGKCDHKENTILVDIGKNNLNSGHKLRDSLFIDPDYVDTVRSQIPSQFQKRHDLYEVIEK